MSLVKPPSFQELIRIYGSPKRAIQHLIEVGFSPEQIEWKTNVPYHRIRLYMEDKEPKEDMPFAKIAEFYERITVLRGKKGKETELAKFFQDFALPLQIKTCFALGVLTEEHLKVGEGIIEKSISLATGASINEVKKLLIDYGEHGEIAYLLKKPKTPELTVAEVYEAIRLLPKLKSIRERELYIASLIRISTRLEKQNT